TGLMAGLSTASKYNGIVFIVVPIIVAMLTKNKHIWVFLLASLMGFVMGCPYSIIRFNTFWAYFSGITNAAMEITPLWNLDYYQGIGGYFRYYLSYALGWPLLTLSIIGMILLIINTILKIKSREFDWYLKTNLVLLIPIFIIYIIFSNAKRQVIMYGLPLYPFLLLLSSKTIIDLYLKIKHRIFFQFIFFTIAVFISGYTLVYSLSYTNLFVTQNVREDASGWIEKNIPKTAAIGLTKRYFWTPPVLRQYHPPYKVVSYRDDHFSLIEGIQSLKQTAKQVDYLVLSDFEYRDILRLSKKFPEEVRILKEIMHRKFHLIAKFEKSPSFLGISFNKKWPPWDWMYPNPTIIVLKKD
ncbi:MAG: hypothetical protein AB1633_07735, partial [Elusimicrobiota bacterium]